MRQRKLQRTTKKLDNLKYKTHYIPGQTALKFTVIRTSCKQLQNWQFIMNFAQTKTITKKITTNNHFNTHKINIKNYLITDFTTQTNLPLRS